MAWLNVISPKINKPQPVPTNTKGKIMKKEIEMRTQRHSQPTGGQLRYWLMLLLAILCVAGAALAAGALRGHANFAGRATLTPLTNNQVALELNVAGTATHLGKCTVRIQSLADVSGSGPTPIPPSTGVITAANGDTVSFTLTWTVDEVVSGVFDVIGRMQITGGTGRFTDATGSGAYEGRLDANNGTCAFDGSYELLR